MDPFFTQLHYRRDSLFTISVFLNHSPSRGVIQKAIGCDADVARWLECWHTVAPHSRPIVSSCQRWCDVTSWWCSTVIDALLDSRSTILHGFFFSRCSYHCYKMIIDLLNNFDKFNRMYGSNVKCPLSIPNPLRPEQSSSNHDNYISRWPIEPKFSQICYFIHIVGYTKWEYLSLTVTKGV